MNANAAKILVVDDEQPIRRFLRASLQGAGYAVLEAEAGEPGLRDAAQQPPELVILDLGLPDIDGLTFLTRFREWSKAPVIVLSARGREQDKIAALDAGADDYLTKPFGVQELLARIRAALRRTTAIGGSDGEPVFQVGDLVVDRALRKVTIASEPIHLTPIEYQLLAVLVQYAGKVVTHRQLLREVWGPSASDEHQYLRVYVGQLRKKLEADPAQPRYLLTELGVGYRLAIE